MRLPDIINIKDSFIKINEELLIEIWLICNNADEMKMNRGLQFSLDSKEGTLCSCSINENNSIWNFQILNAKHMRKGYGSLLFKEIVKYLKEYHKEVTHLYLYCKTDNIRGLNFWKKMGFTSNNIVVNVYGQDVFRMTYKVI